MFGRKPKVTITGNTVRVYGDVTVEDIKGINVLITDHGASEYYPTAEQARNLVQDIRHDIVNAVIKDTLDNVRESARKGRTAEAIEWGFHPEPLNTAEKNRVRETLEKMGYEVSTTTVFW